MLNIHFRSDERTAIKAWRAFYHVGEAASRSDCPIFHWGNVLIPIQAEYLHGTRVEGLLLVQAFLLTFSLAALFQFGAAVLSSLQPSVRWLQAIPAGLLIVWMTVFLWSSQASRLAPAQFVIYANIWARYLLGIPGAMIAAWGLIAQSWQRIQIPEISRHARAFQITGLALASYALLAGLIVPPASFFPANVINSDLVMSRLGVPVEVLRSAVGLVLVISAVRGLEIFQMEADRRVEEMKQAQILMAERERISRELHDGAIQTIYTAGLITESIRTRLDDNNPLATRLDSVIAALDHVIRDLRQFILDLAPKTSNQSLAIGLRQLVIPQNDALCTLYGFSWLTITKWCVWGWPLCWRKCLVLMVVGEAGTGAETLRACERLTPDLVLLDVRLPDQSGVDLCRHLTERWPETRVIILTSFADDNLIAEAILAGAAGYVLKQVGNQELLRAIEAVRHGKALLDPQVTQRMLQRMRRTERLLDAGAFRDRSKREVEVLLRVAEGKSNQEIAEALSVTEKTVRSHVSSLLEKLELRNRVELATYAVAHHIAAYLSSQGPRSVDNPR